MFSQLKENDIIGYGDQPNDLAGHLFRAHTAKKYGFFGTAPMWGGIKIHRFYPPISSALVNLISLRLSLLITLVYAFSIFALYRSPAIGVLFVTSYFFISPLIRAGRFPEILGHLFVIHAFFTKNYIFSGSLLGLAGLTHPISFIFGSLLLLLHKNIYIYLIAFLVCSWWTVPFFLNRKKLGYLHQTEYKKTFVLYWATIGTLINNLIFIFAPTLWGAIFSAFCWLSPWSSDKIRIFQLTEGGLLYLDSTSKIYPQIEKIKQSPIAIFNYKNQPLRNSSQWPGMWAIATYLLHKDIIVYNAYPETEIPPIKNKLPKNIKKIILSPKE